MQRWVDQIVKVLHLAIAVEKGGDRTMTIDHRKASCSHNVSGVVEAQCFTANTAQVAQILHLAVCVQKGIVRNPCDLADVINTVTIAIATAAKGAQVGNAVQNVGS